MRPHFVVRAVWPFIVGLLGFSNPNAYTYTDIYISIYSIGKCVWLLFSVRKYVHLYCVSVFESSSLYYALLCYSISIDDVVDDDVCLSLCLACLPSCLAGSISRWLDGSLPHLSLTCTLLWSIELIDKCLEHKIANFDVNVD